MIFLDYDFLIFLSDNSVNLFKEMKSKKYEILEKYKDVKDHLEFFDFFIKEYYDFFYRYIYQNNYIIFYYIFQSHFLDPDNFELYDEDFIQDLIFNTFLAFEKYYKKYYSKENILSKTTGIIDFEFFAFKNISRVMVLEFNNLKRKKKTRLIKDGCTVDYESILDFDDYYFINEDFIFLEKYTLLDTL